MTETMRNIITSNIEKIIINYVEESITEEIRDEFVTATINFILNEEIFNKYDITRIRYKINKIKSQETIDCLKLYATYGYILYRTVLLKLVDEKTQSLCCEVFLEISNEFAAYLTMKTGEEEFDKAMAGINSKLNLSDECGRIVLEKLGDKKIDF